MEVKRKMLKCYTAPQGTCKPQDSNRKEYEEYKRRQENAGRVRRLDEKHRQFVKHIANHFKENRRRRQEAVKIQLEREQEEEFER